MANMSYCRFENTLTDLLDCHSALIAGEIDETNEIETRSMVRLVKLCKAIGEDYEWIVERYNAKM